MKNSLTVKSKTSHLKRVREFVFREAARFGFSEEEAIKISLAVDEACTNIIKHAYKLIPDKLIRLTLHSNYNMFKIQIEDNGTPFDPDSINHHNIKERIRQYKSSGYGMYIMKSIMDKVEYDIEPGRKNRVTMIKYLK